MRPARLKPLNDYCRSETNETTFRCRNNFLYAGLGSPKAGRDVPFRRSSGDIL
jgi:hypothetical protein